MDKITKEFSADISIEDGERAIVATMTTSTVDRDGEVLQPAGLNSVNFEKNPVVMMAHNYYELPIGKVTAIKRGQGKWSAKIIPAARPETHPESEEWFPDTIYSLFKQGVLSAVSVGLIPRETRPATEKDIETFGTDVRRVVSKWELLELSVCAIPCNPDAVATAVGKGIIRQDVADKIFGKSEPAPEPEAADPEMGTCAECGKEFAMDDLEPVDGEEGVYCKDCRDTMKAVDPAPEPVKEDPPQKRIHREIEELDEKPVMKVRVHNRVLTEPRKRAPIRKMVIAELQKRRGRIYQ